MIAYVTTGSGTNKYLVYAGDLKTDAQPTYALLDLPSNFTGLVASADAFDTAVSVTPSGNRLMLAGVKLGGAYVIWECTNWTSIKDNPTPPSPTWSERVVFGSTVISGETVDFIGTLTAGQGEFTADGNFNFNYSVSGGGYRIGKIDPSGALSKVNITTDNSNHAITSNAYCVINLTAGTSAVKDFTSSNLYTFTGSLFGTADVGAVYRNYLNGPAITAYVRADTPNDHVSIRNSAGYFDLVTHSGAFYVRFGGNPNGTVIYATTSLSSNAWVSTDGGASWSVFASWYVGYLKPQKIDANIGALWVPAATISSGNVPLRFYDAAGNVQNDLTGNWWSSIFSGASSTAIMNARAWYKVT